MVDQAAKDVEESLDMFGTYTFGDKGPQEVMDIDEWVKKIETLSADDAAETLTAISQTPIHGDDGKGEHCYGSQFAACVGGCLEDWDEVMEHELAENYYW